MVNFLLTALTSFVASFILIPFIIRFSKKKKLYDAPGKRRIHKKLKPSLGGAAIFAGFTFSSILWIHTDSWTTQYFLLPILIIPFILGLIDDLMHLRPIAKIIGQTVTATLVFFTLGVKVNSLYGLIDFELPWVVSYLLTIFVVIFITNSFNLIDGIDGLAAVFSSTAIILFGLWFYFASDTVTATFCFSFTGAIIAFLLHNWEPSKIFMGDTGSLVIGTMLAVLTIQFLNTNASLPDNGIVKFQAPLAAVLCILIIPVIDTIRVVLIRLSKRISPFTADKRHIHHTLVRLGNTHRLAVLILCTVHIFFIGFTILLRSSNQFLALGFVILAATIFCFTLDFIFYRHILSKNNPPD